MDRPWLRLYPAGVPDRLPPGPDTLVDLLEDSFRRHAGLVACRFRGVDLDYAEIDQRSRELAAWLQSTGLLPGDRVAVMLSNLPQVPVAAAAILRAGMVLVNVNPLCTPRELCAQLSDAGARAIVVQDHLAVTLQAALASLPPLHVVVTGAGDLLGALKGAVVNLRARHLDKQVPPWRIEGALPLGKALAIGKRRGWTPQARSPDDIALLQYTTGSGAPVPASVLLHRNLAANLRQVHAWIRPALARLDRAGQPVIAGLLPLHHLFGFQLTLMLGLWLGARLLLLSEPRDIEQSLAELASDPVHLLPAAPLQFAALSRHAQVQDVDWSGLVLSLACGTPVQADTAALWVEKTASPLCEAYGLTEAGPLVACNPVDLVSFSGWAGVPLPGTDVQLHDDEGQPAMPGQAGEVVIRGPQVMAGYWQRPEETSRVMTAQGYLRSGDIGILDDAGRLRIVERKRDLIVTGGFSVVPREVEEVIASLPGVRECAAVGLQDDRSGQTVKVVVVRERDELSEADVRAHCEAHLSVYKRPRVIEFRSHLPRSATGKVMRHLLRAGTD